MHCQGRFLYFPLSFFSPHQFMLEFLDITVKPSEGRLSAFWEKLVFQIFLSFFQQLHATFKIMVFEPFSCFFDQRDRFPDFFLLYHLNDVFRLLKSRQNHLVRVF